MTSISASGEVVYKSKVETVGAKSARLKRCQRELWSRERRRVKNGGNPDKAKARKGRLVRLRLTAPAEFDISDLVRRPATVAFLDEVRRQTSRAGIGIIMDFSSTVTFYAAGAVLLLAEIDRALAHANRSDHIQVVRPTVQIADEVLQQIGFYARFNIECNHAPVNETVVHWRSASGVLSDGTTGGSMLEQHEGRLADGISKGLYGGIVEAMTNTLHHAYLGDLGKNLRYKIGRRWWMLSEEREGLLTVAICDLGIGIPRSLPRSKTYDWTSVKKLWKSLRLDGSDASAIQVALELGNTRTGHKGRGHGLADIFNAVNLSTGSGVYILSNKGSVVKTAKKPLARNYSQSIRGTLVHWRVPIAEENI